MSRVLFGVSFNRAPLSPFPCLTAWIVSWMALLDTEQVAQSSGEWIVVLLGLLGHRAGGAVLWCPSLWKCDGRSERKFLCKDLRSLAYPKAPYVLQMCMQKNSGMQNTISGYESHYISS